MPVAARVMDWDYFQVRIGATLYVGIPFDMRLARRHFAIRRLVDQSGETAFFIRDLGSHCGFTVNGTRNQGSDEMPLRDGDRIQVGAEFVFRLERPSSAEKLSRA